MTDKLRPMFYVAAALVLGSLYLSWCHDPRIRREAIQGTVDKRDDSTIARLTGEFAVESARSAKAIAVRDAEIARLKRRVIPVSIITDSVVIPDSVLVSQLTLRDSIIRADSLAIQARDSSIARLTRTVVTRDSLIHGLQIARENWRRAAQPNLVQRIGKGLPWVAAGLVLGKLLH